MSRVIRRAPLGAAVTVPVRGTPERAGGGPAAAAAAPPPPAAEQRAAAILARARAEAEAIRRAAEAAGRQQGYQEGLQRALAENQAALARLRQLAADARQAGQDLLRQAELQALDLALVVARQVVARTVAQDRTVVLDLLRAALAEVDERLVVRVRVSPEDVELVRTHWGDERAGLVIVGDERIAAGGCVIETRFGLVDARPETRLAEAEQLLWSVASDERGAARAGERA